jgi:hypothetical protein
MYKILVHLHTQSPGVYRFLSFGGREFATLDLDVAVEKAKELLKRVGYHDVKIVEDKSYRVKVTAHTIETVGQEDIDKLERLLGCIGSDDLTLSSVSDYDIDIVFDEGEEEEVITYSVELKTPQGIEHSSPSLTIKAGEDAKFQIGFEEPVRNFHFVVNGEEFNSGLPSWLTYEEVEHNIGIITLHNVTQNMVIELIPDIA